ncbi:unnamed protein product [Rotaria socialis]|uniref:HAT C-terminal dimerisation domain-containing protein n=1 Tax=Rotaria socialis TaxID=392032 RepID=A0A817V1X8_9BILA|nr:unnamed protein product [Rotaria socialis]CAF4584361.1 unnamed protein product [Rotaria socialis]
MRRRLQSKLKTVKWTQPINSDKTNDESSSDESPMDRVQGGQPFQEFWSSYEMKRPRLAALVRAYNIRSVSSVASESLFSIAGYVQRKRRSSLASNTLYYSMVLRDQDILPTLIL